MRQRQLADESCGNRCAQAGGEARFEYSQLSSSRRSLDCLLRITVDVTGHRKGTRSSRINLERDSALDATRRSRASIWN